jgi:hypothetical protein
MGTLVNKKKGTTNINNVITEIKSNIDQFVSSKTLQPASDPLGYSPQIYSMIDFVNVTDTIGPSQG